MTAAAIQGAAWGSVFSQGTLGHVDQGDRNSNLRYIYIDFSKLLLANDYK